MKNAASFLLFAALCVIPLYGQSQPISETDKLASLCRVWGLLKYHHPHVVKGKLDWDAELMRRIPEVLATKDGKELSNYYSNWIDRLGKARFKQVDTQGYNVQVRYNWINDPRLYSDPLQHTLQKMAWSRAPKNKYAHRQVLGLGTITFKHERRYPDSLFPAQPMRLLTLYRYWNIINYYFPHRRLIDQDWDNVLEEMIPVFRNAADTVAYNRAMRLLANKTDDSHAEFVSKYSSMFGKLTIPAICDVVEHTAVIATILNDSLCALDDLRHGDAITSIDGVPLSQVIDERIRTVGASNLEEKIYRSGFGLLFAGNSQQCHITYRRAGEAGELQKDIHRYPRSLFHAPAQSTQAHRLIDSSIGYVDMGILRAKDVNRTMHALENTKSIIFDVRNYPKGSVYDVTKYTTPGRTRFATFTVQAHHRPGMYQRLSTMKCGKKHHTHYSGNVIILCNSGTQSHAEFTCMALQTAPHAITIGSQTSGADGNVASIYLPGNYSLYMTGLGVYYPDRRPTQRVGIIPGIEVHPTVKGMLDQRDEVLERAVEYARTGK